MSEAELYVHNISPDDVERKEIDGTEHLVAPVTFIKSMNLHRGYVPIREIRKATERWTGTPGIAGHPTDENGQPISLNSPEADKPSFAEIKEPETESNGTAKTSAKLFVNVERAEELGGEPEAIKDALAKGRTIGVSSSYGGTRLPSGEYDGEQRDKVIGNIRPDHIALFRNNKGVCSIEDGCMAGPNAVAANENIGVMVNAIADDPGNSGEASTDMETSHNALSEARTPEFSGTTTASWSAPTFSDYVSAFGWDAEQVDDLSEAQRQQIAEHTLLGDPEAETFDGLQVFPVVVPQSSNLSENALVAVLGGRGAQADVPEGALESARNVARTLLEDEFGRELESSNSVWSWLANALGIGGEKSGNGSAESDTEDTEDNEMSEKTEELVELGFNAENLPDEDTECFNRIHEKFVGNEEPEEEPDEPEETEQTDDENSEPAVTFESEEEFEDAVADVVDDAVEDALAANQERQERSEIVDDIIANSDDHDDDDREELMDTPKSVLQTLKDQVSSPAATPNYGATRGVSANQSEADSDSMPALSASERLAELEGSDD